MEAFLAGARPVDDDLAAFVFTDEPDSRESDIETLELFDAEEKVDMGIALFCAGVLGNLLSVNSSEFHQPGFPIRHGA